MELDKYFVNGFRQFIILAVPIVVVYVIIATSIEKKINRFNEVYPDRAVSTPFVSSAVRTSYFVIGLFILLSQITPLRPVLSVIGDAGGILALCVTFAAKESISNYISGFLITVHKPFKIGDKISLQEPKISGTVKEINFRHTVIDGENGSVFTVPNSIMNSVAIEDLPETETGRPKKKTKRKTAD